MMIKVDYKGGTYFYSKNSNGVGSWVCIKGRCPVLLGTQDHVGLVVPMQFAEELRAEAVSQGINPKRFRSREKKKPVSVRNTSVSKNRKSITLNKSFNPFKKKELDSDSRELTVLEYLKKNREILKKELTGKLNFSED